MTQNGDGTQNFRGYAGNVTAKEAWLMLENDSKAVLIDVRTRAEWSFVGIPDLSSLNKEVMFVEWQAFPPGPSDSSFVDQFAAACEQRGVTKDAPLLFLCRSGNRSQSAAIVCTEAGFENCLNVADGFEGDLDQNRHRNSMNGWKRNGLPWFQS